MEFFNRHKAMLERVKLNDIDNAVLDYMELCAYRDTEDCNKLQAYEVIEYFKSQIMLLLVLLFICLVVNCQS